MIRRPPRSTLSSSSAASDVYKRQPLKESMSLSKIVIGTLKQFILRGSDHVLHVNIILQLTLKSLQVDLTRGFFVSARRKLESEIYLICATSGARLLCVARCTCSEIA